MTSFKKASRLLVLATAALTLAGCAGSTPYVEPQLLFPKLPNHITTCPSTVELKRYIKQIEATTDAQQRKELARTLQTAIRRSELKNNRCLKQAISYYEKIRKQKAKP
jgi:N-acyl-L-homoserine lactone synthetase